MWLLESHLGLREAGSHGHSFEQSMLSRSSESYRSFRAEAAEQRVKTLQVSLGAARMNVRDLIESREADRFEMAELRSRAHDIEAGFWDLERHLGP
ncbi:hypothetical protein Tco_1034551 [Tanacetum coccineum]